MTQPHHGNQLQIDLVQECKNHDASAIERIMGEVCLFDTIFSFICVCVYLILVLVLYVNY